MLYRLGFFDNFDGFTFSFFWDKIAEFFEDLIDRIIDILPDSPFLKYLPSLSPISQFMGYVNWVIPFGTLLKIFTGWVVCITTYYLIQAILRYIKVAGS